MAHSLSNEKSRMALSTKLRDAFYEAKTVGGMLVTWDQTFDKFAAEAIKSLSTWVTEADVLGLVYSTVWKRVDPLKSSGIEDKRLVDGISSEIVDEMVSEVINLLSKLPENYEIDFPLPSIKVEKSLELSDRAVILPPPNGSGRLFELACSYSVLRIHARGYARISRQESAMRDATSTLKVIFFLGHLFKVFAKRPFVPKDVRLGGVFGTPSENIQSAVVNSSSGNSRIQLTLALSQYLNEISIPGWVSDDSSRSNIADMQKALSILYSPAAEENVQSIRRALEWAFDAEIEEDETTRFVKTCIGLEAALTDQVEGVGITEQLADRCAFVLNKTASARETTRKKIREIYRLRSKIVHGAVVGLSPHDAAVARDASIYLSMILRVEIRGVTDWWEKRQLRKTN